MVVAAYLYSYGDLEWWVVCLPVLWRADDGVVTCVGVLTYPNSPDYRLDTDHLSPVQVGGSSD